MGRFAYWLNENKKKSVSEKQAFVKSVMDKYGKTMPAIDADRYGPIEGLEGPFRARSGKILYYDPKEGKYWDRDSDIYVNDSVFDENFNQQIAQVKQDRSSIGDRGFSELDNIRKALILMGQHAPNKLASIVQKISQELQKIEQEGDTPIDLKSGLASLKAGISRI